MVSEGTLHFKYVPKEQKETNTKKEWWDKRRKLFKACVCYFLSNFYFSPNDRPSKTMKNVFYFI